MIGNNLMLVFVGISMCIVLFDSDVMHVRSSSCLFLFMSSCSCLLVLAHFHVHIVLVHFHCSGVLSHVSLFSGNIYSWYYYFIFIN